MRRGTHRSLREPPPPRVVVRAPEDIVAELAGVPHPDVARDPDESLAVLERLINEARVSVRTTRDGNGVPTYRHETAGFLRAMNLVDEAPCCDLRAFAKIVIDLLWGVGIGSSKERARRLERDREWEGFGILAHIAAAISVRSFAPFRKRST